MTSYVKVLESWAALPLNLNIFAFNIMCVLNPRVVILQQLCIYCTVVCIHSEPACSSDTLFIVVFGMMSAVSRCQHASAH